MRDVQWMERGEKQMRCGVLLSACTDCTAEHCSSAAWLMLSRSSPLVS